MAGAQACTPLNSLDAAPVSTEAGRRQMFDILARRGSALAVVG
jgi:hypothetical protein